MIFIALIGLINITSFQCRPIPDPAVGGIGFRKPHPAPLVSMGSLPPGLLTPPVLNLTLNTVYDSVFIIIDPDQPLHAGWTDTNFVTDFPAWDYWWLNTRLGIDRLDSIYVLVSRYNYSNNDHDFRRIILDNCGNRIHEQAQWNGYQGQPIVKDGLGYNHYIGHPVLGWFDNMDAGITDQFNRISTTKTDSLLNVRFTKLDSTGNMIIDQLPVATGDTAQSWTGDTHLAMDLSGAYYAVWSRDQHEIVYARSADGGYTWSTPVVIAADFTYQVNKPEIVISPDNCRHFIWQRWDGQNNYLMYKKLDANDICLVDTSNLTPGAPVEVWAPEMTVDQDTNLHIVWASSYEGSENLYHTVINGRYGNNGLPAADSQITIVQEYAFYGNSTLKRYPKIIVDSLHCLHVIFDQGAYGLNTGKQVYHIKKNRSAQGYVMHPDSTRHEFFFHGNNAAIRVPAPGHYFVKAWAWNSNGETGWDTASIYVTAIAESRDGLPPECRIRPTITRDLLNIYYRQAGMKETDIMLFDITGRVRKRNLSAAGEGRFSISLKDLPAGIYYLQIKNENILTRERIIRIK